MSFDQLLEPEDPTERAAWLKHYAEQDTRPQPKSDGYRVVWWTKPVDAEQDAIAQASRVEEKRRQALCRWGEFAAPERHKEFLAASAGVSQTVATEALGGTITGIVVLLGGCGCGKTLAAVAWLRQWVFANKNPYGARFLTAPELARIERFDEQKMKELTKLNRLVIDDLGTEFADTRGAFASLFDEVTNARHSSKKPTVVTTNLDVKAFTERYGQRIVDRIRESGAFNGCGSESLRGRT